MKSDALASVERRNAVQQEKIAQVDEFAAQILIPATDLDVLNALRLARGTTTAAQTAPFQTANISGQSGCTLRITALKCVLNADWQVNTEFLRKTSRNRRCVHIMKVT